MTPSELANELREVANRIEAAGFDESVRADFELNAHGVTTRSELAKWTRLAETAGKVSVQSTTETSYLQVLPWRTQNRFGIAVHFEPGLLGGKAKTVIEDDANGLAALLRECPAGELHAQEATP